MSNVHQSVVDLVRARIGTVLKNKWHIDELLGLGGMAAVYSATHRTGSRVAIKMLHPQLSLNDAVRKRFAREGYVANTIGHPGIARVLDDDVADDGSVFLVMELLEGETAAARAERNGGKLPMHEVAFIGESVAEVLAAAHANGVIHRDIKPDNIFLTSDGRVVVLDFGIARVADATGISDAGTRTGTMMGTPAFMPPEQARGRANEMDATSDVWALGSTLFWLATGRVVHPAETPNEQLVAAATFPAPSIGRIAPEIPAPLVAVIDQALEYAKENRFPDAVAMQQALHQAILEISWDPDVQPGLIQTQRPPPPDNPSARSLGAALASGAFRQQPLPTVSEGGRGPTFGPVEVTGKGSGRATKFVLAAVVGAAVAGLVLLGVIYVRREAQAVTPALSSQVSAAMTQTSPPPPAPPPPTPAAPVQTALDTPTAPTALAVAATTASASASASHTASPAPANGKKSWLDRRK